MTPITHSYIQYFCLEVQCFHAEVSVKVACVYPDPECYRYNVKSPNFDTPCQCWISPWHSPFSFSLQSRHILESLRCSCHASHKLRHWQERQELNWCLKLNLLIGATDRYIRVVDVFIYCYLTLQYIFDYQGEKSRRNKDCTGEVEVPFGFSLNPTFSTHFLLVIICFVIFNSLF